ncbi:hypothetical protein BT69DRAFT_859369 [Atractiella rhizophila]|nr:hypothetical protein BT69DRAFT_859369 [Atractiella rhizophila]
MSYSARLREVRRALNPYSFIRSRCSHRCESSLSVEVRSGFAITGWISSISCVLYVSGVAFRQEGIRIRLILEVTAPPRSSSVVPLKFPGKTLLHQTLSALCNALAAIPASIASHPDIPHRSRQEFTLTEIVLAATGCVFFIVSSTTSIFTRSREGRTK